MYIPLQNRQIIRISGEDRFHFIQGLITNDIELLKKQDSIYACMLTPQGKFLYEFFIFEEGETLCLDTEKDRIKDTLKRLSLYKLRAKIDISIDSETKVFACFEPADITLNARVVNDLRHTEAGVRLYSHADMIPYTDFCVYDKNRIRLGLADGARDMTPEFTTIAEAGIEEHNGVSYTKGCYVGQEVTARIHNRGLVKKKLTPIQSHNALFPQKDKDVIIAGKNIGKMCSSCGDLGLILLKLSKADVLKKSDTFSFV